MDELEQLRESIKQRLVEGRDERLSDLVEDAHPVDVSRPRSTPGRRSGSEAVAHCHRDLGKLCRRTGKREQA